MSAFVRGVTKRIGKSVVLDNVTLDVPSGSVVGLSGVNGSGKTMLMRVLCGFVRPTRGVVEIDGKTLWKDCTFPSSLGMLIEGPAFIGGRTGRDNLRLLASVRGVAEKSDVDRALERVGLDPDLKIRYREYSLGMRQRLGIAAAVMEQPRLLVLDEPTNALDEDGVQMVRRVISEERMRGAAILVASHDSATLECVSDRVHRIASGRIEG